MWATLAQQIDARERCQLLVTWVKGHAKQLEIDRGIATWVDKCGNDAADALATAGAEAHAPPQELTTEAVRRQRHAAAVHRFAAEVLLRLLLLLWRQLCGCWLRLWLRLLAAGCGCDCWLAAAVAWLRLAVAAAALWPRPGPKTTVLLHQQGPACDNFR